MPKSQSSSKSKSPTNSGRTAQSRSAVPLATAMLAKPPSSMLQRFVDRVKLLVPSRASTKAVYTSVLFKTALAWSWCKPSTITASHAITDAIPTPVRCDCAEESKRILVRLEIKVDKLIETGERNTYVSGHSGKRNVELKETIRVLTSKNKQLTDQLDGSHGRVVNLEAVGLNCEIARLKGEAEMLRNNLKIERAARAETQEKVKALELRIDEANAVLKRPSATTTPEAST